jgi:thermitase
MFLVLFVGFAAESDEQDLPLYVPGEVLVGVNKDNDTQLTVDWMATIGTILAHDDKNHAFHLKLRKEGSVPEVIQSLQKQVGIRYAEPNWMGQLNTGPNDPRYSALDTNASSPRHNLPYQYGPQQIKADLAWTAWQPRRQIIIAIVDTGINNQHEDLIDKILHDGSGAIVGYSSYANPYPATTQSDANDSNGHGTECAGIAAARINNGKGIAGIAAWDGNVSASDTSIKLMPIHVANTSNDITATRVGDGIRWAADHGANVISLSLSLLNYQSSTYLTDDVNYAWNKGCLLVAAPNNDGNSSYSYPAHDPNVISVAASDSTDKLAGFSTYGSWVSVAAPGGQGATISSPTGTEEIYTTTLNGSYDYDAGTSMACPHVAGEAALIWSQNPNLNNSQVKDIITGNTDPVTPYTSGHTIGSGRINAYSALLNTYGYDWKAVAYADLNADGKPDIILQNQSNGDLYYWLMYNGPGNSDTKSGENKLD